MLSSMVSSRAATGWPIAAQSGALVVARPDQRLAQGASRWASLQFGKSGPPQQRPQRRIAERGPVEFGEMGVAAACCAIEQQGIADVVERRAVLPGRQRAVGGTGDV